MPNDLSWLRPLHIARGLILIAAGAAPLMAAPSITATKDDGVTTGTKVAPGGTVTYTNRITNGPSPATAATGLQFEDPNVPNATLVPGTLKATPVAVNDTLPYTVIANTSINTATAGGVTDFSVVDNDFTGYKDGAPVAKDAAALTVTVSVLPAHGTVNLTSTGANIGKFIYTPTPGYVGTDSFSYVIDNTITGATTLSVTGTVSLTVGGPVVWIVNPAAPAGGVGNLASPFNTLAAAVTAMGTSTNQRIFLFTGTDQDAGVVLNEDCWLVGQAVTGTSFDTVMGITYPVDTVTARPAINLVTRPKVTRSTGHTVVLGNRSKVRAVDLINSGGGFAINATTANEALVGDVISSDPTVGDVTITTRGSSSGAVSITSGNAAIQINAPITAYAGRAVNITNLTGSGAVSFPKKITNPVTDPVAQVPGTGTGINITGNSATSTFAFTGGLDLNTKANNAFNVTGGGTITATQNNLTIVNQILTTTGVALNVANTNIGAAGLEFRTISSTGGGANVGISLVSTGTAGGLTVTGFDGNDVGTDPDVGSGGTITGKTGSDGATNAGFGVYLSNTSKVSLNYMLFSNFDNSAIRGISVTKFRLTNSTISGFSGNNTGVTEGPIAFGTSNPSGENGIIGTGTNASVIDKVVISGAVEHGLEFYNQSGSFGLTISNCTIGSNNTTTGSDGVLIETQGSAVGTININNNTFDANKSQAIQVAANDSSAANLTISNNTITRGTQGNEGIVVSNGADADLVTSITNNTITGFGGVSIFAGQTPGNASSTSLLHATITGNLITSSTTATNHAILASLTSTSGQIAPARLVINNNTVTQNSNAGMAGIFVGTPDSTRTPDFHVAVTNNNVDVTNNTAGLRGIVVQATRGTGHFKVSGNDVDYPNGIPGGVVGLRVRQAYSDGAPNPVPTVELARGSSVSVTAALVLADNNPDAGGTEVLGTASLVNDSVVLAPGTPSLPLFFAPSVDEITGGVSPDANVSPAAAAQNEPVAASTSTEIPFESVLSQKQLDTLVAAARARWEASGLSQAQREKLGHLSFQVADLPGTYLGEASGDTIRIDSNAGGNSWFIDATPMDDSEFSAGKVAGISDRVDLLTTVMHEMGHSIGLCDSYSTSDRGSLMFGFLSKGERRVPQQGQAKDAEPHSHSAPHFLDSPIDVGTLPPGKEVIITYQVTLNNPQNTSLNTPAGSTISSQGTVHSTTASFTDVLTDDSTITGAANPTTTLVDLPQVTVVASAASLPEDGTGTVTYTFSRTGATTVPLVVNFSTGGTAAFGTDYTLTGGTGTLGTGTITIPTGSSSGTLIMSPADDTTVEGNETVILTATAGTAYEAGTPASATSTINNDDTDVTLAVSPSSVTEDGAGNLVYTFTRAGVTSGTLTVNFDVSGDAVSGTDYEPSGSATFGTTSGTVTFTGSNTTATVTLNPTGDNAVESDETAVLTLATGTGYNVASPSVATGTITNDDSTVKIELLAATSVAEDGAGNLVYTLTRTGPITNALTVNVDVSGTASSSDDFTHDFASLNSVTGAATVTFAANSATKTVTIDPATDTTAEEDETVILTLAANGTAAATGGYEVDSAANTSTGTILNDDTLVNVAVSPATSGEGSGTGMVYTFTRTGATTAALPVNFTVGGAATLTTDFTPSGATTFLAASGTVTIPIGEASATVTLTPAEDVLVEGSETAILTVATGTGYAPTGSAATGTITDNDTATIGYAAATSTVGEDGVSNALDLVLTLNATGTGTPALARDVTVSLTSAGGSATVATDYVLPAALTFASGSASGVQQQAIVAITNDRSVEGTEVANLGLSITDGTNGQVTIASAAATHVATITDNDTATIAYAGATSSVGEAAGTTSLTLGLAITGDGTGSQVLARDVTVNITTVAGGTATNGGTDYSLPSTVTFASGASNGASQVSNLTIVNDVLVEGAETATLGLEIATDGTDGAVTLGGATHTVTINDNDSATVAFVAATGSVSEGAGTHSVGLVLNITSNGTGTAVLAGNLGVNVITGSGGSATGGVDYTLPAAATFAAGSGNATGTSASVTINEDSIVEGSEIANLGLSLVNNFGGQVTIGATGVQALTITDNDTATLALAKINDGAEAATSTNPLFTITQSAASSTNTVISYTVNGTASSGADYTALSGSATILAGNTSVDITVPVINDSIVEPTETVGIALGSITSGQASVTLGSSISATADIADNDTTTLTLAVVSADKNEGTGGTTTSFTFSATLTNGVQGGFTIPFTTNDGTATVAGSDYTDNDGTLTFSGTASESQTITVLVTQDSNHEQDETFSVALGSVSGLASGINASNVTVAGSPATGTIRNDDALTVTVAATDNTADEVAGATGTWRVSRNTAVGELAVQLAIGAGSTASSADWTQTGATFASLAPGSTGTLVIPDGSTFVDVTLTATDDIHAEANETVILNVVTDAAYTGGGASATVTIAANDFVVVNTDDSGEGSLRQAVANANNIAGAQTITFEGSVFTDGSADVITLTSGEVEISNPVTIAGRGAGRLTVSGNNASRVFMVTKGPTTFRDLSIVNGVAGGGDGGGISFLAFETLTVVNCDLRGNSATRGGAICVLPGSLNLIGSTIRGNTAPTGGGLALMSAAAESHLQNSTWSGNSATVGGGIYHETGPCRISHCTVTGNTAGTGSGIASSDVTIASTYLANTLVAANAGSPDLGFAAGSTQTIISSGGNVIGNVGAITTMGGTDVAGTTATPVNPLLDPLADNGGPTLTHAIRAGSPALNRGLVANIPADIADADGDSNTTEPAPYDQRGVGYGRNVGTAPDAGAFELGKIISIAALDASKAEGSSGTTAFTFTVSRIGDTVGTATVNYAVTGSGTNPTVGADFGGTLPSGTFSIPDGQASATLTINVTGDTLVENTEEFTVTLTNPPLAYVIGTDTAIGTITDDDTATLSIAKVNDGAETNPTATAGVFRVSQSAAASTDTVVSYSVSGSATSPSDFAALSGSVTIPAGSTSADVNIAVVRDFVVEGTENVSLTLSGITSGDPQVSVGTPASATLDIIDNLPATIVASSGSAQSTTVNTAFAAPLVALVTDAAGNPLRNASVTFTAPASGASAGFASSATVTTNASGLATSPTATANTTAGSYTISAATSGVATPANFTLTNTPGVATHLAVVIPSNSVAGVPVATTVTALDQFNNVATGYAGTVTLSSSDAAATLPASGTLTNGSGSSNVTFKTGGNQTVTANGTPGITGTSNASAVSPRADLAVSVTDSVDPVDAGANLTYTITVTNAGPSAAESISLADTLPAGTTFVSLSSPGGWSATTPAVGAGGTINASIANMPVGSAVFTLTVNVGYLAHNTVLSNSATVTSTIVDPNPGNETGTATTTVSAIPEIAVFNGVTELTDGQATPVNFGTTTVNNPLTRTFTVRNVGTGPLSLTGITLPSGYSLPTAFTIQTVAPTASFSLVVRYDASSVGVASGSIVIANNDDSEPAFDFPITAERTNLPPVATAQSVTTDEDVSKAITLAGTDPDGDTLGYQIMVQPVHGMLSGTLPNITYIPDANYNGPDSFEFRVNDGTVDSAANAVVSITVNAVNDEPVVAMPLADVLHTAPGQTATINLANHFSDIETLSTALTYTVTPPSGPVYYTYNLSGTTLTITGTAPGIAEFSVTASDGELSVSDEFEVHVKHVPEVAGSGIPDTLLPPDSAGLEIDLGSYFVDGDGDAMSYLVVSNTDSTIVEPVVSGPTLTLHPHAPGTVTLTIRATDSDLNSFEQSFDVTIDKPIPVLEPTVGLPPKVNPQTGSFEITVTATNHNQFDVPGFRLRVTSVLPNGIILANSTGPAGAFEPYLDVLTRTAPGQSLVVKLEFQSPRRNFDGFNPTIVAEPLPEGLTDGGTGAGLAVTLIKPLADGSVLLEFTSQAGKFYEIQYSSDGMQTWKRCLVPIQASANRVQWIDRGSPYTDSHPNTVPSRFYRVSQID